MAESASKKGYRIELQIPHDKDVKTRPRALRWIELVLYSIAMLVVPAGLLWWWGSLIDFPTVGAFVGCGLGIWFASWIIPKRFLVDNPEWTAYVTQNMFGGEMVAYGPGLHPSKWYEERNEDGNISLEAVPLSLTVTIPTGNSQVTVSVEYEYARRLSAIRGAIGFDASAIESGLSPFVKSFLISECNKEDEMGEDGKKKFVRRDAKWARTHVDFLNEALADTFMGIVNDGGETLSDFEEGYGIILVSIAISNVAFSSAVQKSLDAIDESASQLAIMAKLYGYGDDVAALQADIRDPKKISRKEYLEMLEHAMAVSENAKMEIQVFRGDIPSAAASLAKGGNRS